ncbi:hypothetical protein RclHR1_07680016 [Rhizophagus clarus]|uniref:MULE transposase domain-containing protein n=1 Tax=Rhizophagus clarus TaxID=94130 RepID=A0A2Z6SDN1_9GLOM|nr:hypothetical protein RclHR1_07680016 [Rhizophagus clarus]
MLIIGIKAKMLASLNGTSEENIRETLNNQQKVCSDGKLRKLITRDDRCLKDNVGPWTILHNMIKKILKPNGFVLYYQMANPNEPEDSPARYYQLTVSDEFWLRNRRDFGKICVGLDGKYDPNIDRAPVLSIVVENNAGCRTPLAFALSNKENHVTIHTAISAIKQNILCNDNNCEHHWYYEDLSDENGFRRIHPCSQNNLWNPYIIIDKHRPSKLGVDGLTRCVILCWFHIIQTLGNNFKEWQIPQQFSHKKDLIINGIKNNWMCDEWRLNFIDAGRISYNHSDNSAPWTMNNFTERIHCTIEATYSGKQTVLSFLERLYGVKLSRDNLTESSGQVNFEAGLVTLFNARSIEQLVSPYRAIFYYMKEE